MAFQLKDFASITASMINYARGVTRKVSDFTIGSVIRTLFEAPAIEIEELYQAYFNGLKEGIPVALYTTLDFDALPAIPASNLVRISVTSSSVVQTIPANTVFAAQGIPVAYTSQDDVAIMPGNTFVDVRVVAQQAGSVGNIVAGMTFSLTPSIPGFVGATNLAAFKNGMDAETESERKVRFGDYIASLAKGTIAAIEYGLKTTRIFNDFGLETERVVAASVIEPWLTDEQAPISLVNCYVHNGVGGTSSQLLGRAREVIFGYYDASGRAVPGWKAAGVRVEIYPAVEAAINVAGVLTQLPGFDNAELVKKAESAIYSYILSLPIGDAVILSEIVSQVKQIDGVFNIVLSTPTVDVTSNKLTKLMPGAIAIT